MKYFVAALLATTQAVLIQSRDFPKEFVVQVKEGGAEGKFCERGQSATVSYTGKLA